MQEGPVLCGPAWRLEAGGWRLEALQSHIAPCPPRGREGECSTGIIAWELLQGWLLSCLGADSLISSKLIS